MFLEYSGNKIQTEKSKIKSILEFLFVFVISVHSQPALILMHWAVRIMTANTILQSVSIRKTAVYSIWQMIRVRKPI